MSFPFDLLLEFVLVRLLFSEIFLLSDGGHFNLSNTGAASSINTVCITFRYASVSGSLLVPWSLEWFPATPKWNSAFPAVANKNVCNEKDLHGNKEKVVPQQ